MLAVLEPWSGRVVQILKWQSQSEGRDQIPGHHAPEAPSSEQLAPTEV